MATENRENLTPDRIRQFTCPADKSQAIFRDAKTPGLGVRVTAKGAKSYIYEGKANRQTVRVTIGDVRSWPLESVWSGKGADRREIQRGAREEANRLQALIDQGLDPRQEKADRMAATEARQREADRAAVTVAEAWTAYVAARLPYWGTKHASHHEAFMQEGGKERKRGRRKGEPAETQPGILTPFLALNLADLDAERVRDWLSRETKTRPTLAHQAFRALKTFLRWCEAHPAYTGIVSAEACIPLEVRDLLPRVKAKDDCLQREQLALWFESVGKIKNPAIRAFLQAALLTGARREELATLQWSDVDFQWRAIRIRDKVEGERTIPLTPYVGALLAQLPRRNRWVFSSTRNDAGRMTEPRIAHKRALAAAGLPGDLSIHGLRRSFGTLAEWTEAPTGIVAQIMGHKPSALAEKHYRRRPLDLLRLWHTRIEAWILEQAGIPQPAEDAAGLRVVKAGAQ